MGTFNKNLLTSNFKKIYKKFAQKFKTILQNCSKIKFNKILRHLQNFQNFSESVNDFCESVKKCNCVLKTLLKFEIYLKIKNFNKILKIIKNDLMDFIKVCESF